ncbi:MAG TPA: FAD binding domain-containing protein [Steroidobacteraceae bacterium]|nr:FAD binding domain-containing protein [Steroidobacteraceae bacterium]
MKPAPFRYVRPRSVFEAVGLLLEYPGEARLLAGGQSLVPLLSRRLATPALVIDINHIAGLDAIEVLPDRIRMGALVRQEQALRSQVVRAEVAGLAEALAWVANPVIRQRGTVIGNLVANTPGAELPAVAMALGAQFVLRHLGGEETVGAASLLGPGRTVPPQAMVTHVLWPRRPARAGFYEVARRDGHAPVVAAVVTLNAADCRVALSGVMRTALVCPTLAHLIGRHFPDVPAAADFATALSSDLIEPVFGDAYSSARYRLEVAPVVSRRAAQRLSL